MNRSSIEDMTGKDPLGLGELPLLKPDHDGWPEIRQALETGRAADARKRAAVGWLAAAAAVVLTVLVLVQQNGQQVEPGPAATEELVQTAAVDDGPALDSLIALSQTLESQLRELREGTGSMPASSAVYVAELEDLVTQVDGELSYTPDSLNLWGQRVNLLLDLAQIYQHHWELEYGQMASL